MSTTHVIVYTPAGVKEEATRLNAIDLVRHCGYTYKPGKIVSPVDGAPYATTTPPKTNAAQEVLDRNGYRSGAEAEPATVFAAEPKSVFDAAANEPAGEAQAPAPQAEPAPAAPDDSNRARRQRRSAE